MLKLNNLCRTKQFWQINFISSCFIWFCKMIWRGCGIMPGIHTQIPLDVFILYVKFWEWLCLHGWSLYYTDLGSISKEQKKIWKKFHSDYTFLVVPFFFFHLEYNSGSSINHGKRFVIDLVPEHRYNVLFEGMWLRLEILLAYCCWETHYKSGISKCNTVLHHNVIKMEIFVVFC